MKKIILDVDTGIDDALAISYAVHSPALEVLGITTTFGNITVEEATRNTVQILEFLGYSQIPVYAGAKRPLFRELKEKAKLFHGENGLGNIELPPPQTPVQKQEASAFMIEQARRHPGKLTIVTVGSMTNLAKAIRDEPEMTALVERVVVMGGAVTVPGNRTPVAEANICADPEAAELVFQSGIPVTMVGLDVTMQTLLTREHLALWREKGTDVSRLFADMCEFYMNAYAQVGNVRGCGLHDPLAVGVVIDPTFVTAVPMHVSVDTSGGLSDARTIGDRRKHPAAAANVDVCLEVDHERFVEHFLQNVF
ncbi:nucleoside hydrolase [Brevibacillus borstelensis]|uniref:nucleoside hydrolase n=1 Tax=Brevibacillus borstelensis TaxID=45462 RepID=UPI0004F2A5CA|nr:nucleoside hydrolase [Brevibacillus borstelensis]KKX55586.1 nucleoside hydrolase [Brevibacillus borstelensis cifa_chp40]